LLTCPSAPRPAIAAAAVEESLTALSLILERTLGSPDDRKPEGDRLDRRRVPSAGGLTSQEAFVVSRSPLPLLDSTTAWYDWHADRLVATAPTTAADVARLTSGALPDAEWRHAVVWVARVGHLSRKYGDLAVRLAHLDAGVAMTHAALVAATLGSPPRMPASWRSAPLVELLDLSPDTEIVTGIMLL
jgi:SagB-type dehydrogenase family enzyme